LEYLQQLWNEVLVEDTTLLEGTERFKHKKVFPEDNRDHWPFKKAKGKQPARYHRDIGVKMGILTPVRDVCVLGRTAWCTIQDE